MAAAAAAAAAASAGELDKTATMLWLGTKFPPFDHNDVDSWISRVRLLQELTGRPELVQDVMHTSMLLVRMQDNPDDSDFAGSLLGKALDWQALCTELLHGPAVRCLLAARDFSELRQGQLSLNAYIDCFDTLLRRQNLMPTELCKKPDPAWTEREQQWSSSLYNIVRAKFESSLRSKELLARVRGIHAVDIASLLRAARLSGLHVVEHDPKASTQQQPFPAQTQPSVNGAGMDDNLHSASHSRAEESDRQDGNDHAVGERAGNDHAVEERAGNDHAVEERASRGKRSALRHNGRSGSSPDASHGASHDGSQGYAYPGDHQDGRTRAADEGAKQGKRRATQRSANFAQRGSTAPHLASQDDQLEKRTQHGEAGRVHDTRTNTNTNTSPHGARHSPQRRPGYCFNCGHHGHKSYGCAAPADPQRVQRAAAQLAAATKAAQYNTGQPGQQPGNVAVQSKRRTAALAIKNVTCFRCGALGHYASHCLEAEADLRYLQAEAALRLGDGTGAASANPRTKGTSRDPVTGKVTCFRCGALGHYATGCQHAKADFRLEGGAGAMDGSGGAASVSRHAESASGDAVPAKADTTATSIDTAAVCVHNNAYTTASQADTAAAARTETAAVSQETAPDSNDAIVRCQQCGVRGQCACSTPHESQGEQTAAVADTTPPANENLDTASVPEQAEPSTMGESLFEGHLNGQPFNVLMSHTVPAAFISPEAAARLGVARAEGNLLTCGGTFVYSRRSEDVSMTTDEYVTVTFKANEYEARLRLAVLPLPQGVDVFLGARWLMDNEVHIDLLKSEILSRGRVLFRAADVRHASDILRVSLQVAGLTASSSE